MPEPPFDPRSFDPERIDPERVRGWLLEKRAELLTVGQNAKEARGPVELDQSKVGRLSRMDALQGQAMALETERRRGIELQRIDAALVRLDEGEFGYCVSCGEVIAGPRIALDPSVPNCIDCAGG